jgi:hypothetical protein
MRQDQTFLDDLPDDSGHLIAIQLNNRPGYLDSAHT